MTEFEMTQEDHAALIEACRAPVAIALNCGMPRSQQENANAAWEALGKKMGFDHMTVRPSRHGQERFFWAEPRAIIAGQP